MILLVNCSKRQTGSWNEFKLFSLKIHITQKTTFWKKGIGALNKYWYWYCICFLQFLFLLSFFLFFFWFGNVCQKFEYALKSIKAPCTVIMTLNKLKTVLPSLKAPVEKALKSCVVYDICCSQCISHYLGQLSWHLKTRIKEHLWVSIPSWCTFSTMCC